MSRNRLGQEKSPYLLQHRDNPVWWYPWGEEAFAAARDQKKPIFLSIGYSTCYWCHVMEKDSFEREDVAAALNRHFISIKVDREERPDVDQLYMQAVVALSGHGGWPMSVFLTPELKPFWGGTYFPRAQFLSILEQIHRVWEGGHEKITASAESLTAFLREQDAASGEKLDGAPLRLVIAQLRESFDDEFGGFGSAPKFPPAAQLELLMRLYRRGAQEECEPLIAKTLSSMARGGLYDQLGGGFHRYSTDAQWLVPHFEKMLYDNALLACAYTNAYRLFGDDTWSGVARETLEYMLRDLQSPEGAFYAAEDAGEVGKEGEFYVWRADEIQAQLSTDETEAFMQLHQVSDQGNFEHGTSILTYRADAPWLERSKGVFAEARKKMLAARSKRRRPHRDDKVLLGWNALAVSAFCTAFQAFQEQRYLENAQRCARFLKQVFYRDGKLLRRYRDGDARIDACQEDFAFLIAALIDLYESDFDESWLGWARELQATQDALFWDRENGGYFYSVAKELPAQRKEYIDGATPSGNSVALMNLVRLQAFFPGDGYGDRADDLLAQFAALASRHPSAVCKALQALDFRLDRAKEIVIIRKGDASGGSDLSVFVQKGFFPNKVLMSAERNKTDGSILDLLKSRSTLNGDSTAYVCEHGACKLPTSEVEDLKRQLETRTPL